MSQRPDPCPYTKILFSMRSVYLLIFQSQITSIKAKFWEKTGMKPQNGDEIKATWEM